jgi:chloramphenicol 3-O-phosphotransferase
VDQLVEAEEEPKTISDLEAQIDVLKALYEAASKLFARGEADEELRDALRLRGYNDWTLENVYAFVYDAAVDQPAAGPPDFVNLIRDSDFAWILRPPPVD